MWPFYLALAGGIVTGIGGQILLKAGADSETIVQQLLRPQTIVGLMLYTGFVHSRAYYGYFRLDVFAVGFDEILSGWPAADRAALADLLDRLVRELDERPLGG